MIDSKDVCSVCKKKPIFWGNRTFYSAVGHALQGFIFHVFRWATQSILSTWRKVGLLINVGPVWSNCGLSGMKAPSFGLTDLIRHLRRLILPPLTDSESLSVQPETVRLMVFAPKIWWKTSLKWSSNYLRNVETFIRIMTFYVQYSLTRRAVTSSVSTKNSGVKTYKDVLSAGCVSLILLILW